MDDKVKELLERIKDTAGAAADSAADTARIAGKRAGHMVDVARLNVQLFDLNSELNDTLRKLGQVMYEAHQGSTSDSTQVNELLTRADEISVKVSEIKARIDALKVSTPCPNCGAACGQEDKFCRRCGEAL